MTALLCLAVAFAPAQVKVQVGGGLGVVVPSSDFGGSTVDYYSGTKYGLSTGYNIHGKARFGVLGFALVGGVDYASLSNSGNSEPGIGKVEVNQKILSLKVGPEFNINIPLSPVKPYLDVTIAVNRFSGETTFQGVSKVSSATYVVESVTRIGLGAGGGVVISLGPLLNLDIGLHYNLMNLAGKSWNDVNPLQDQRIDSYLSLNDDKDPLYLAGSDKHFIGNSRSIHSIQLTASVLFGL